MIIKDKTNHKPKQQTELVRRNSCSDFFFFVRFSCVSASSGTVLRFFVVHCSAERNFTLLFYSFSEIGFWEKDFFLGLRSVHVQCYIMDNDVPRKAYVKNVKNR